MTAEAPLIPLTVCEVVRDLPSHEGRNVAVLGRYSFRETGVALGEQSCQPEAAVPPRLQLVEDGQNGPKPPDGFALDGAAVTRKLADVRKRTDLGKFRFGTPDYDRWAVIYGALAAGSADRAQLPTLRYRGSGVVIFLSVDSRP